MRDYLYNLVTKEHNNAFLTVIRFFLFLLSLVYCLAVRIYICFWGFFPLRMNCKVISVGNITVGGTGKTTLVEYIAGYLSRQGHKVAVLSRGYKRRRVSGSQESAAGCESMGDEPYMLSKNLGDIPVIVDADRARGACLAVKKYGVDTVILDDGFQQWRIAKDLEIVTIDANNPFGNRHVLPRGILREPLSSLQRADVFVLTKVNLSKPAQDTQDILRRANSDALVFESAHKPEGFYNINKPQELLNTHILKAKAVVLVSGIGDPASFESLIKNLGINIGFSFRFPDHHNYTKSDMDMIAAECEGKKIDTIVTTEKDMARISALAYKDNKLNILILRIKLAIINDEHEFHDRLLKLYPL